MYKKTTYILDWSSEGTAKLRWAGGSAQRPVLRVNEPKTTGVRNDGRATAAKTH
jgi:hypothetical protein